MSGFLLDTEALLSAATADERPGSSRAFLQRALRQRAIVCVCSVSLVNVGRRLGRLRRQERRDAHDYLARWCDRLLSHHPLAVLPVDAAIALTAGRLLSPGASPQRAFIAACALVHDLAIVTARPGRYAGFGARTWPLRYTDATASDAARNAEWARQARRRRGPVHDRGSRRSRSGSGCLHPPPSTAA